MKNLFLLLLLPLIICACTTSRDQSEGVAKKRPAPGCDELYLDLERGRLNGIGPSASPEEVKQQFPCVSAETEEGADYHCGGGVFYSNHSVYFYTHADFFEVRRGFTGQSDLDLLNKTGEEVQALLGRPSRTELLDTYYYDTKFGCFSLRLHNGRTQKIGIHATECAQVDWCN